MDLDFPGTQENKRKAVKRLWHLQSGLCYICGKRTKLYANDGESDKATFEHVWPKSRTHESSGPQVLVACLSCNKDKKDEFPTKADLQLTQIVHWAHKYLPTMGTKAKKNVLGLISSLILTQYEDPE